MIHHPPKKSAEPSKKSGFNGINISICVVMILASLALLSHSPNDWNILNGGVAGVPQNWIGPLGARFSLAMLFSCGLAAYLLMLIMLLRSIRVLLPGAGKFRSFVLGTFLVILGTMILLAISPEPFSMITHNLNLGHSGKPELALSGGLIGQFLAAPPVVSGIPAGFLYGLIGHIGTMVVGWILVTVGGVVIYLNDWHSLFGKIVFPSGSDVANGAVSAVNSWRKRMAAKRAAEEDAEEEFEEYPAEDEEDGSEDEEDTVELPLPMSVEKKAPPARRSAGGESKNPRLAALLRAREGDDPDYAEEEEEPEIPEIRNFEPEEPDEDTQELGKKGFSMNNIPVRSAVAASTMPSAPSASAIMETPTVGKKVVQQGEDIRGCRGQFVLPLVSMLAQGTNVVGENLDAIELAKSKIQQTLENFSIPGRVSGHVSGPRVTRYEITLEPGVNVKRVEQIQDNIRMDLAAQSIRVLAPIPGRSVVGIEVSNSKPEAVFMRSIMESDEWLNTKAEIPLALGKNVSGKPVILDLAKAPHMLVAGATGTGKSVCSNSIIASLLFRFRPDELRLIMVDPKIVEFEAYKTLPHLLTPIINDSAKVPIALRWAANEMDHRYRILAKVGVKKLSEFNNRPRTPEVEYDDDGNPIPEKMPLLVIILDELADLMMTEAKKDVETNIARIAQKGRAAGIHIIVATQRPDAKIVTGVIKANLPTRLCFQVRSQVDSRVVLDAMGAEKLLGVGDMLAMTPASMELERVQGAWVKDDDIKNVVKFVSDQAPQHFNDTVLAESTDDSEEIDEDLEKITSEDRADIAPVIQKYLLPGDDDTMRRALEVVVLDRKASTSYLQRRLKIGYNRAAELIEEMEERGIVGPPSGSGAKRDILIFDGIDIG